MSRAVIDVRDVSFAYGDTPVLEGVSLQVEQGEFLGLVGPNAGGKSTLLKIILGLLEPMAGSVEVMGRKPAAGRAHIGYCAQYATFPRDFPITVQETVLMGRLGVTRRRIGYDREDRRVAREVMQATEVAELADRTLATLSGGQLQRVMIARALASEPAILLLDEPTANIDMRVEEDIFDLLRRLNARMTIVVVSHDVGFISNYVSRVACLNRTLVCHATAHLTGEIIDQLYRSHVHLIRHAH